MNLDPLKAAAVDCAALAHDIASKTLPPKSHKINDRAIKPSQKAQLTALQSFMS
jgi:hypothetical protein